VAEDEGTERRSEDLFEDLDKFFAPIQDVDWPEDGGKAPEGGPEVADDAPADGDRDVAPGADPLDVDLDQPVHDQPVAWEEPVAPPASETETGTEGETEAPADREPEAPADLEPEPAAEEGGFGSPAADEAAAPTEPAPWESSAPADEPATSLREDMFGPPTDPRGIAAVPRQDVFASDAGGAADDDDELLPSGWATGLDEGIDLDLEVPTAADEAPAAGGSSVGEDTAQMSAADWAEVESGTTGEPVVGSPEPYSYMEQFLPDETETEVPEFGYGPEPGTGAAPAGGTTGIDWDEPSATPPAGSLEDSGPISIDDLRKAPDEYRDLPGAGEAGLGGEAAFDEPAIPGSAEAAGAGVAAGDEQGLEAAAEHFAASIREEEDLAVPSDDPLAALGAPADGDPYDPFAPAAVGDPEHREPYSDQPEPLVFPDEDEEEDLLAFEEVEPGGPRTVKVGAADPGDAGPSWQEPTSVEVPVEGEQEPPKPGRNLSAAIVTGVVLGVVALIALAIGKVAFGFVAGGVVLLAQIELYTAIRKRGYQPAVPLGLAVGALICIGGFTNGEGGILAMTTLGVLFTPLWYMATPARHRKNVVANMGMTMLGIMAVPFLGGFALAIIHTFPTEFTIYVLILAFGYDIAAYGVGTLTGNKPLAPTISPNKTREGAIGGFLVLAIVAIFMESVFPISSYLESFGLAFAAGLAALIGDLAESLIKRDLGVKDMGTIFPGHGGALDRIDSVLFVAPVVYYFVRIFVF
jgi:phosphatidate cytidylyltransferase